MNQPYFAKLLLFGEYTIIIGGDALAMPFRHFSGRWTWEGTPPLGYQLEGFAQYIKENARDAVLLFEFDSKRFEKDIKAGMYFEADIPVGYGLGSSGALCAALYDRYVVHAIDRDDADNYAMLKKQLAQMESYFHGKSSGIDPLICYLDRTIWFSSQGAIHAVKSRQENNPNRFFLFDSQQARQTEPLVQHFQSLCEDALFFRQLKEQLLPATEMAIQAYIAGDSDSLRSAIKSISVFQFEHLQRMITDNLRRIWALGLEQDTYSIKLCGAGGGGYYLGYLHKEVSELPLHTDGRLLQL